MNILFRRIIICIARLTIWQFSDAFSLSMETLAKPREVRWFNVLLALGEGVFGPILAITAVALGAANKLLLLATICLRQSACDNIRGCGYRSRTEP